MKLIKKEVEMVDKIFVFKAYGKEFKVKAKNWKDAMGAANEEFLNYKNFPDLDLGCWMPDKYGYYWAVGDNFN